MGEWSQVGFGSFRHRREGYNISMSTATFDPDALRDKYREERDKRLRDVGNEQYIEVVGEFERLHQRPVRGPVRT